MLARRGVLPETRSNEPMRCHVIALGLLLLVGLGSTPVLAQSPDTLKRGSSDWALGASLGLPGYGAQTAPELFTLGFQATQLRPGRLGADFSIGTMPALLVEGVLPVGVRLGVALPVEVAPRFLLVPSAGFSGLGVLAIGNGGGGSVGLNAGVAAMVFGTGSLGLRAGVTCHQLLGTGGALWLVELGFISKPKAVR